jgi:transcriptional antiterminator RfaH
MNCWYTVSTKNNLEFVALENLERQSIYTYLPKIYKYSIDKKKIAKKLYSAFFPGYLFVKLDIEKDRWQTINSTIGVNKIISFGSGPISISDYIVEEIKKLEDANGIIKNNNIFQKNDSIIINGGVFSGSTALFDKYTSGKNRVNVLLNMMGVSTKMSLDTHHIQKI